MDELKGLTVTQLSTYLMEEGVSEEATECLADNKVSGRALLLFESHELKDLLPMGDLAIIRDILRNVRKVSSSCI